MEERGNNSNTDNTNTNSSSRRRRRSNNEPAPSSSASSLMEAEMQAVLDLMAARAAGRATSEQVELAVARVLGGGGSSSGSTGGGVGGSTVAPATAAAASAGSNNINNQPAAASSSDSRQQRKKQTQPEIQLDTENYDDDDDSDGAEKPASSSGAVETTTMESSSSAAAAAAAATPSIAPATPKRGRGRPRKHHPAKKKCDEAIERMDVAPYQDIPLGPQGAAMMTAFGDGRRPRPAAVAAALQGARLWLRAAVRDARHHRRHQRRVYRAAKDSLKADRPRKPALQQEWSNEMLYRASAGYDQLAYDPRCGFRTGDLRFLFPEEMNAYERWNEMHAAAEEQQQKEAAAAAAAAAEEDTGGGEPSPDAKPKATAVDLATVNNTTTAADAGGHLRERAAQFDWRTDRMADRWYLTYAHLRQRGSFLPRSGRGRSAAAAAADDEALQRQQQRGWGGLAPAAVRFLHWVGFDPQSALPPPSDDTTDALAFLGYDFFGRIVEKAISLKLAQAQQQNQEETGGDSNDELLVELPEGEQLDVADIERALQDPDIKVAPIYASSSDKAGGGAPLLYFGPGFENRLELELDEMLHKPCEMSPEERQILQEEDAVFARLAEPPPTGATDEADKDDDDDDDDDDSNNNDGEDDSGMQDDDNPKKKAASISKRTTKRRRKA